MENDTGLLAFQTDQRTLHPKAYAVTPDWLLGTWRLAKADAALDFAPGVRMEFAPDNELRYNVDVGGTDQIVDLLYTVDGDTLNTENVITAHSMSVTFTRESGDVLMLDFGGVFAWFLRE